MKQPSLDIKFDAENILLSLLDHKQWDFHKLFSSKLLVGATMNESWIKCVSLFMIFGRFFMKTKGI